MQYYLEGHRYFEINVGTIIKLFYQFIKLIALL